MTRDEALSITSMILTHWRGKEWSKEEIDVYARLIQDMDAELTTHAVIALAKEISYRPSISELREKVRSEKKKIAPTIAPITREPTPVPFWVKRWLCARFLYAQFHKERDERRFTEQGDFGDFTKERMPEGVWVNEAESLDGETMAEAWNRLLRS